MTLKEAYHEAKRRLRDAGVEDASFDAACLFQKHTGVDYRRLPLCGGEDAQISEAFFKDIERRAAGEPLQYILGEWEFMGLPFRVGPGVLIPRPETELLCGKALDFLKGKRGARLLELCAGTGCVSIAAAKMAEGLEAFCLEYSPQAMRYLAENVELNAVQNCVHIRQGDLFAFDAAWIAPGTVDVLCCNPPYIRSGEIAGLQREVRDHEPRLALDGGADGLAFYRAAAPWFALLKDGGMAAFEIGAGQAAEVSSILSQAGLRGIFVLPDYAGIERVVGGFR